MEIDLGLDIVDLNFHVLLLLLLLLLSKIELYSHVPTYIQNVENSLEINFFRKLFITLAGLIYDCIERVGSVLSLGALGAPEGARERNRGSPSLEINNRRRLRQDLVVRDNGCRVLVSCRVLFATDSGSTARSIFQNYFDYDISRYILVNHHDIILGAGQRQEAPVAVQAILPLLGNQCRGLVLKVLEWCEF